MRAVLSPDDLKQGDLAEPGWYPAEIVKYDETEAGDDAKNPGSTNCNFYFKLLDGPSKGITCKRLFNETALGFGKRLWAVFFGAPDPVKGYTGDQLNSDVFKSKVGLKLKIHISRGMSNKKTPFNDVDDFLPLDKEPGQA